MRRFFILLAVISSIHLHAQNVIVQEDPAVERLMQRYTTESKQVSTMPGWRIQIITTDDRRKMEAARSKFSAMYPDLFMEWEHVVPYYKVKVGAYREKIDLQSFLVELRKDFPSAIPIPEEVKKTELVY